MEARQTANPLGSGNVVVQIVGELDKFVWRHDASTMARCAISQPAQFIDAGARNLHRQPGTGKTHLCIGVASAIGRSRARGRFFNRSIGSTSSSARRRRIAAAARL